LTDNTNNLTTSNKYVIFSVVSNEYFNYLESFLSSANIFLKEDVLIDLTLINIDHNIEVYLKSIYQNINVKYEYVQYTYEKTINAYCGNYYAYLFPEIMNKYSCPIIYMDIDSLFINNPDNLLNYVKKYDVSFEYNLNHHSLSGNWFYKRRLPKGPFGTIYYGVANSAIIMTNNSKNAKKYFSYNERLMCGKNLDWYADQEALFLSKEDLNEVINFNVLPEIYCSRLRNSNSIIWMAKGSTRKLSTYSKLRREYINKVLSREIISIVEPDNYNSTTIKNNIIKRIISRLSMVFKVLFFGCKD
jgi:hypothetical protein